MDDATCQGVVLVGKPSVLYYSCVRLQESGCLHWADADS